MATANVVRDDPEPVVGLALEVHERDGIQALVADEPGEHDDGEVPTR